MHETQLIATLAIGFALAFMLGYIASRLRLPPLVGYLVAGVFAGPFTPGLQADASMASQLAEIGVILLMFGVGLHFSIPDLMAVRRIAVPGALGQIVLATLFGMLLAAAFGWGIGAGLVFGLSLSVASTVVLLKALEDSNRLDTPAGRVAVGWLIVEDLAMVLALVLLPAAAEALGGHALGADAAHHAAAAAGKSGGLVAELALTLGKVAAFVALAMLVGPRLLPWLLGEVARTGSRELFTLSVLAIAVGIAVGSAEVFGVSFALGAFFAGVVLSESHFGHRAAAESLPLQDAFSVLFFVSVGMLFDPSIILREPLAVVATLLVIMFGKAAISLLIVAALRYPLEMGLRIAASLSQIGEFSFILAGLGLSLGLLPAEGRDLVLAGALLSITLNKTMTLGAERLTARWTNRGGAMAGVFGHEKLARLEADLDAGRQRAETRREQRTLRIEALLATFPLLANVPAEDRDALLLLFRPRNATPGTRVIRRGDRPDGMYFLASGRVEVETESGKIDLNAGAIFGEMALLDHTRRTADVTAVDYCELLILERRDFDLFMSRQPTIAALIRQTAAERQSMNIKQDVATDSLRD
ncbi:hypothetical protein GCM10011390_20540 [Aureimonas endophytica]|uniref:Cyclic nucleotide-binding domain-containing protein n=1 Tax=Aureimonas endophytica TaxID=2027858 RepID=A0A916ZJY7_9HYPH|nr:cation:proton antiporter [Aureimonas endophytica]GGE01538.1 hypothetical protein GCM10011390_20540 [Aureimonas endophytica]